MAAILAKMDRPAPLKLPSTPRKVVIFSGHRVDPPGRMPERFPARLEAAAAACIGEALDRLDAGASDAALTQGAAGGDVLFAEACVRRGVPVQLMQPVPEAAFLVAAGVAFTHRPPLGPALPGVKGV